MFDELELRFLWPSLGFKQERCPAEILCVKQSAILSEESFGCSLVSLNIGYDPLVVPWCSSALQVLRQLVQMDVCQYQRLNS